ncbi:MULTISPECIES: FAD-dependent oxidoreductase [unclassified Cryobacterium]|uniref:FAD-dependent oxidoreductase n=1 Tax=unclassified Cryobacterium TaxID=2649013 RepID=UPI001069AA5E|nr:MULTISPECIES: FAD-dependent oxidoreductase [unclassified Cryobacterium]TFC56108.1 monooxygenase [Cryobacterium sp. TMB3-1-2]TFC69658.1 monooxygenase [Cryobacterium sp. TMB3-15]TFC78024.1 monooxygenase [Cryobacterium sp. TMB3-10]TFD39548.1 monooxygenase [Cryobacterium sp. TMB3-12]
MAGNRIGTGTIFDADVLIVGAGPTGLALARELHTHGVTAMIVDRAADAAHESRALAIQARTLEVLARNGLADDLVSAGNPTGTLLLHGRGRRRRGSLSAAPAHAVSLFDEALFDEALLDEALLDEAIGDTRFPFLLFLSQAGTERVLVDRLASAGVGIRRGLTLTGLSQDDDGVTCTLDSPGVPPRTVRTRYVVGCDGAHSATRHLAGIGFSGRAFPQRFLLADLEADGLEPGRVHVYLSGAGPLFLFPLGSPAGWRLLVMLPPGSRTGPVTLALAQAAVTRYTRDTIVLHDPVWLTEFTISSRLADTFARGRVFLAGDAAHIHSPAGAQGMNTGIQDAVNLGWKLALVCRGAADPALLGSYEQERLPVARSVLAGTNRAFTVATSQHPVLRGLRAGPAVPVAALLLRSRMARRTGFRLISELGIHYRRSSLSVDGVPSLDRGPRPGERFPQPGMGAVPVSSVRTAAAGHGAAPGPPVFRMLLCGPAAEWPDARVREFQARWAHLLTVELTPSAPRSRWSAAPRAAAVSRRRSGLAQYLVRWDGYVGYRADGSDLDGADAYLLGFGARPLPP